MTLLSVCSQTSFIERRRFQALSGTSSTCLRLFVSPGGFLPASYQGPRSGHQGRCFENEAAEWNRRPTYLGLSEPMLLQWEICFSACCKAKRKDGLVIYLREKKKKEDGLNQESSLLASDSSDGKCQLQTAHCFSVVAVMVALWTGTSFRFLLKPPKVFSTFFFQQ